MRMISIVLVTAMAAACGSDDGPSTSPPTSVAEDLRFEIDGIESWYLIGNALTAGETELEVTVDATAVPDGVDAVDVWVAGGPGQRLTRDPTTGRFTGALAIGDLAPAEHEVLFAYNGRDQAFARRTFTRSHPLYFVMTTDWDFADPGNTALEYHDDLRAAHPTMRFTHFIGPYTFTDSGISDDRKHELATWAKTQRDQYGDEIGLHIHPWCHFVISAGLTCITDQSTRFEEGDTTGYTIKLGAYGQAGFEQLLTRADEIFAEHELGKPVTFRAGAWTATTDTLKALAAKGFVADTSANNWRRMEEWIGIDNGELYNWNMENWQSITDTSQPYYPNQSDQQSDAAPQIPILEVPDNAIMVDYVTVEEMIEIFGKNWDGGALTRPTTFMMGFHPAPGMSRSEFRRLDEILTHSDQFLAADHAGPVVYPVLKDLPMVWPVPQ